MYFATCGTPKPRYARNQFFTIWHLRVPFISHQNLGDSKEIWEKFFWRSVANKYPGKVTETFQKIPSSFGAVVRKPGLRGGGKLPPSPTCNARVKMEGREGRKGERGEEGDPKELVLFLAFIRGLLRPLCKWPERHCARQGKAFN